MFFRFLVLIHACTAFPLQCPEPAQWSIRARGLCPDPSKYSCLKNDLINGYSENCTISDFQAPGRKGVLRGGLDADICSQERYHPWPIKYYTNVSTNCIFLKSICNEEGQLVYSNGNRNTDITCRCDFTRGYDFIGKPRNPCYCVPSEEDCSCHLKTCIDQTYYLSPDYECIHEKMNTSIANCRTITKERDSTERNGSTEDITRTENIPTIVQRESYTRIIVITLCIGIILLYCIHELRENCFPNATTHTKDSLTLIDHTTEADDVEYKAVVGLGDMTDVTLTGCLANEAQQSTIEELVKDIDGQKMQVKRLKPDRSNVPDWMITNLEQWEKEDEYFVNTRAGKYVIDRLRNNKCVSVVGPPGVGKTFLVKHVALQMEQTGYTICQVGSSKDIRENYKRKRKTLFVVDDFCGHFTADTSKLDKWKGSMNDIKDLLNTESNKLILTCRLQVFQDACFDHLEFELFKTCICNLGDVQLALTYSEKENLALKYIKDIDRNDIRQLYRFDFFPLLCKLYDSKQSSSEFCKDTFVKDPFRFYTKELCTLYNDSLEGKYKVCALLLLVLCNNHLERKVLKGRDEKVDSLKINILHNCNIVTGTGKSFISECDALTGTYLSIENDVYHAIHDKMFDFLTNYFGTNTSFSALLIRYADLNIINERFVILEHGQSDVARSTEYTITVQDDNLQLYIERVFDDLTKSDGIYLYLRSNRNRNSKTFCKTLSSIFKNLKKDKISNLIQTASSGFVRDMFVMDVNDINCYGITLDKVHLEKYIERVFINMVKSDDVKDYMWHCRCCRNEVFRTDLLTYMTSLTSDKIKEQIESGTTSFVQLMFVLDKDDIKPITPHVYERYGVVIADDVIQVYIRRVFGHITQSKDVNEYIQRNRNRKNIIFRTRLLDYMTQLDKTTIKRLIEDAGRSFIYQLCVMTKKDIDEFSYNESGRYGVIIPDECIKLYVGRWFDEMTKSQSMSTYFNENRNRHSNKFKTALRTYMLELEEERIEKLIETASEDFLQKMFVTTKTDIRMDSFRDFEQYGIILPDKYLEMYTMRILDLIHSIEKIKYNRTIKKVLKCLNKLGEPMITELIRDSNTYVFHQMITVDIKNELRSDKMYSDCQSDDIVKNMLESEEGPIWCSFSLVSLYMDRMISDWGKENLMAVFGNKNLKKQLFVDKFLGHLNQLEPSKISELIKCRRVIYAQKRWKQGAVNLAKWWLEKHLHKNPGQENNKLFALFLLVVYNNQLEETIISDELIKITDVKFSFREKLNIREDISAREVKGELNIFFNSIGVEKYGVNYTCLDTDQFAFFVFYFASIRQMSKVLVEYADEKLLFNRFLDKKSLSDNHQFNILPPDEELLTCINRIFTKMTISGEFIECILKSYNNTNLNSLSSYLRELTEKQIITIVESSCIDFINKICVVTAKETQDRSDGDPELFIVIPDENIPNYIKRIFVNLAKSDCIEECFRANRNKRNATFHSKLLNHMNELNRDEIERLIKHASSDFINRMFVISDDDIKPESCWEYERYGIVVPKDLLQIYIERMFSDMTKSVYLPVNRNSENKLFCDSLHSYISSLSEDTLASIIQKAGSKFISRMYLSSSEETAYISSPRIESRFIFVPKKYFQIIHKICIDKLKMKAIQVFTIKNSSSSYIIINQAYHDCDPLLIEILGENRIESSKSKQCLIKYVDPLFTGKIIECCVKSTNDLVSKYIQRLLLDWNNGHVHDVFGNINLRNPTFQCKFITHLRKLDHKKQSTLARTEDTNTKHFPLEVCSFVGISDLAKWCLDNNADTYSNKTDNGNALVVACVQNHPDIVSLLLNHTNKADVNACSFYFPRFTPLCAACAGGYKTIVSHLLKEDVDVNKSWDFTPLYVACENGNYEIVSLLLKKKADEIKVNELPRLSSYTGKTPLYVACKKGHTKIVSLLLNHEADMVDIDTGKEETPLYAACEGGYTDIVILLLARDIRVINKSRFDGASPLWVACSKGHIEVVSTLLDHKNIEKDKCLLIGMSPLFIASSLGHTKIVQTLLKRRADAYICVMNKDNVLQVFERRPKTYPKYITKLVIENASKHVKSYINGKEEGWVLNSILGASPLHIGSLMGHNEIVKLLIESNSSINCVSDNGSTPLFLACELGHEDVVQVLFENGADPTLDRKDGKSPLTIARDNGHMQIVDIIKSKTVESSTIEQSKLARQ